MAPGRLQAAGRTTLPYPPYGTLNYFDQTASTVLDRIKNYRGTAILPQQTGPVADVLYSAAGNSADEAYYNHGIIGYDFEIGASKRLATARPRPPASSRRGRRGGDRHCNAASPTRATTRAWSSPTATTRCWTPRCDYANDTTAPIVDAAYRRDASNAPRTT